MVVQSIVARKLLSDEYPIWDELVGDSPQGTLFHTSAWLDICKSHINRNYSIYGCFDGDILISGCPLFISPYKKFFRIAHSDSAMTPYGGVVLPSPTPAKVRRQEKMEKEILRALCDAIENEGYVQVKIINSPKFSDIRYFTERNWEENVFYTYIIELDNPVLSRNARRAIKKAEETNILLERIMDINAYYRLLQLTFAAQRMDVPISRPFFFALVEGLFASKKGEIWVAKTENDEIVAAEIIVKDEEMVYRWSAASNPDLRDTGAHYLLLYSIIEHYRSLGFKTINAFTGNVRHIGEFTTNFNPKLAPYYGVQKKHPLMRTFGLGIK